MPIYEYKCLKCGKQFEHLVIPTTAGESPTCPECAAQGADLEEVISLFATRDENVTARHMDWVKKESKNLQYERHKMEQRIASED